MKKLLKTIFLMFILVSLVSCNKTEKLFPENRDKLVFDASQTKQINKVNMDIDFNVLTDDSSIKLIRVLANFEEVLRSALEKNEPSFISRYLLDVAKAFSVFYNNNKIICDDEKMQNARVCLTYVTNKVLNRGLNLLGIQVPDKM